MRKGWEYKRWKEVLTIINGKNQSAVVDENGEYPIYGSGGIMGYANNWLCPENCVIIGRKGNINKPIFVETKFWNVDTAFGLNANKEYLLPKFLYYFCLDYNFERHNKAVTIPSLTKADLLKIDIPLPPKSTQLAIVSELDKINELIRLKKEQLKDFDNLAQSLFYEMFGDPVENEKGWEVKKLGEVCTFSQGMQVPIENQKEIQNEGDVRFLRIIDFTQGKDAPRYVECDNDKYILHEKEIAIVRYGTPGFVCTGKIGAIANNLFKLNPLSDNIFVFEYLVHWLSTDAFQLSIRDKKYGAALQAIKFSTIHSLEIIIPPLSLQRLFAQRIEQIEREKSEVQKSIQNLETLLASRMQYWFE